MKKNLKFTFLVEKTDTGFSAFSEKFSVYTTGMNVPELVDNAYSAAEMYCEESVIDFKNSKVQFEIDFEQFFKYYRVLNTKFLAQRLNINPTLFSQYVNGRKKPSVKRSEQILNGIHQIGIELSEINLL